jgi:hypothetical protein
MASNTKERFIRVKPRKPDTYSIYHDDAYAQPRDLYAFTKVDWFALGVTLGIAFLAFVLWLFHV